MTVASRLASLERKHGGRDGDCMCQPRPVTIWCRDPSKPRPPCPRCEFCGRPRFTVFVVREPNPGIPERPPYEVVPEGRAREFILREGA